jgi:hypothetical protein
MKSPELYSENNRATYEPESNKLRLYVGRVPRPEYDALRAEGWQSTAKQDCDFSAVWTPDREDTALSYAGIIEDEDASPADRAADRAERFEGYLGKRLSEATGHADRFDAGPAVHGFQSYARAVKSADRHDRIASRAVNAWDKAEYWQRRTQGVIDHALHLSSPGVRMGRIKTLEADLRKCEKDWRESTAKAQARFDALQSVVEHAAGTREKPIAASVPDFRWVLSNIREEDGTPEGEPSSPEQVRRAVVASALSDYRTSEKNRERAEEAEKGTRPAADIAAEWLEGRTRPEDWNPETSRWAVHYKLRLAYENQMLEAQGGRAALVEMEPGGFIGGHQIHKVNKSNASGRVVSVAVKVRTNGKDRWGNPDPKAPEFRLETVNIERLSVSSYRAPTPEELEAFHGAKKAEKAARPKSSAPSLVNPTMEDAEKLQALINAKYLEEWTRQHGRAACQYYKPKDPAEVCAVPQAVYSANSKGAYARAETKDLCALGEFDDGYRSSSKSRARAARIGPVLCKIRTTGYEPLRVVHITDKPAKPLPAAVWQAFTPEHTPESLKPRAREMVEAVRASQAHAATDEQKQLIAQGAAAGLVNDDCRQAAMTDAGHTWAREAGAYTATV